MTDRKIKQVIVMRTDLNMRKGKMIAQGAHASMIFLTEKLRAGVGPIREAYLSDEQIAWVDGAFTKICVRVGSLEGLKEVHESARAAKLTSHLVTDAGLTEFGGVTTITCCAIGPNYADEVDEITGGLELL